MLDFDGISDCGALKIRLVNPEPSLGSCKQSLFCREYSLDDIIKDLGEIGGMQIPSALRCNVSCALVNIFRSEAIKGKGVLYEDLNTSLLSVSGFNRYWQQHWNRTPWMRILRRIPQIPTYSGQHAAKPIASICFPFNVGSTIIYMYRIEHLYLCAFYTGLMVEFSGIIAIDSISGSHMLICSAGCSGIHSDGAIQSALLRSISRCISKYSPYTQITQSNELQPTVLIGMHYNFGHTLINDCALFDKSIRAYLEMIEIPSVSIGHYDYLETLHLLRHNGHDSQFTFRLLDKDRDGEAYMSNKYLYCPLPIHRPSTDAIHYMRSAGPSEGSPQLDTTIALNAESTESAVIDGLRNGMPWFYLNLGSRRGPRSIVNKDEIVSCLADILTNEGYGLLIDGSTSYPVYRTIESEVTHTLFRPSTPDWPDDCVTLRKIDIPILDICGLCFSQKVSIFRQLCPGHGLAAYGSSCILPLYIGNVWLAICSYTYLETKTLINWHWHLDTSHSRMHSSRVTYVPSLSQDEDGCRVSVAFLRNMYTNLSLIY